MGCPLIINTPRLDTHRLGELQATGPLYARASGLVKAVVATGYRIHICRRYAPWFIERCISGRRPFFHLNRHPDPMVIEADSALTTNKLAYSIRRLFAHDCRATSTASLMAVSCPPARGPTQVGWLG